LAAKKKFNSAMNTHDHVIETLARSPIFRDYQRAFSDATGLPLALRPAQTWQRTLQDVPKENRFCTMIAAQGRGCSACLQLQEKLCQSANGSAKTATCALGLTEVAVPVKLGGEIIGYLVTGQILRQPPTEEDFQKVLTRVREMGLALDEARLRDAYFATRVVTPKVLASTTRLLAIFAEHLAIKSNELVMQQSNAEPALVTRVKEFVRQHHEEDITLAQAAQAAHSSIFYVCRAFRKATGMCFTEFVARTRVEKAKQLLQRPNLRVSEIAFEVGFQSLTHFNRIFKRIVGESPSEYRHELMPMAA
jgi:AraC-like DNA-binding protein/ligand-binding sensor protein